MIRIPIPWLPKVPGENEVKGEFVISSIDDLHDLANRVASHLQAGDILLLYGEVGSGKTTFTKTLATELAVEEAVTSPTFTIAVEYDVPNNHLLHQLVHIDLYRLPAAAEKSLNENGILQIRELFMTANAEHRVIVVEWAERLGKVVPKKYWKLEFKHGKKEHERVIKVTPPLREE